jgi:hypothetical protein
VAAASSGAACAVNVRAAVANALRAALVKAARVSNQSTVMFTDCSALKVGARGLPRQLLQQHVRLQLAVPATHFQTCSWHQLHSGCKITAICCCIPAMQISGVGHAAAAHGNKAADQPPSYLMAAIRHTATADLCKCVAAFLLCREPRLALQHLHRAAYQSPSLTMAGMHVANLVL